MSPSDPSVSNSLALGLEAYVVIHASLISNLGTSAWKISTLQIVSLALRLLCNLSETRPSLHDMEHPTIPPPHPHLLSLQTKERHQKPVPHSWWPLQSLPKLKFPLTQLLTLLRHKPSLWRTHHYHLSTICKISCFSLWGTASSA